MAKRKNEEMDLDDSFHDDAYGDDMDFGDFDYDAPPTSRNAVFRFTGAAVRSTAASALGHESRRRYLHEAMPPGYGLAYDTATETLSDVGELYDIVRDQGISPLKKSLKRTMRSVLSVMGAKSGEGIRGRLFDWAQDEQRYEQNVDPEDAEMRMAMGEIFGQQQQTTEALTGLRAQLKETQVEQSTTATAQNMQMGGMIEQLSQIARSTERLASYQDQVTINFQRRSLELQFRHFFVAKKHMEIQNQTFELLKGGIETLAHNTALPDIVKMTKTEKAMDMLREQAFQSVVSGAANQLGNLRKRIFARGKTKLGEFFRDFGATSSQVLEGLGTVAEMSATPDGGVDPMEMAGEGAGGWLGKQITDLAIRLSGNRFKDNEKLAAHGLSLKRGVNNMDMWFNKIFDSDHDTDIGWFESLKNFLGPGLTTRDNLLVRNDPYKHLDKQTAFDTLTKRTITDIIPAYLSSINAELWRIRNQTDVGGELVWNHEDSKLVSKSDMREFVAKQAFRNSQVNARVDAGSHLLQHADPDHLLSAGESKVLLKYLNQKASKGKPVEWLRLAANKEDSLDASAVIRERIAQHIAARFEFTPEQLRRVDDKKFSFTDATHGNSLKQQKLLEEADERFRKLNSLSGTDHRKVIEQMMFSGQSQVLLDLGLIKKEGRELVIDEDRFQNYVTRRGVAGREKEINVESRTIEARREAHRNALISAYGEGGLSESQTEEEINRLMEREDRHRAERRRNRTAFNAIEQYANRWSGDWFANNNINMDNAGSRMGDLMMSLTGRGLDFLKDNGIDISKLSKEKRKELADRWKSLQEQAVAARTNGDQNAYLTIMQQINSFGEQARDFVNSGQNGNQTNAGQHHIGGLAGRASNRRKVDARRFHNAPRYHTGGMAGQAANDPLAANDDLKDDEVPAVLREGEEVLTSHDPRHRNNILQSVRNLLGKYGITKFGKVKSAVRHIMPKGVQPTPKTPEPKSDDGFVGPIQKSPHDQLVELLQRIADTQMMTYEIIQQRAVYGGMPDGFFKRWSKRISTTSKDGSAWVSSKTKAVGHWFRDTPGRVGERFSALKTRGDAYMSRHFGRAWSGAKKIGGVINRQYQKVKGGFISAKEWAKLDWEGKKEKIRALMTKMRIKFNEAQFEALMVIAKAQDWLGDRAPSWKEIKSRFAEVGIKVGFGASLVALTGLNFVSRVYDRTKDALGGAISGAKSLFNAPLCDRTTWANKSSSEREKVLWEFAKLSGVTDSHDAMNKVFTIGAYQDWFGDSPPRQKDILKTLKEAGFNIKLPMGWAKRMATGIFGTASSIVHGAFGKASGMFGGLGARISGLSSRLKDLGQKWDSKFNDLKNPICDEATWKGLNTTQRKALVLKWADGASGKLDPAKRRATLTVLTNSGLLGEDVPTGFQIRDALAEVGIVVKEQPKGFRGKLAQILKSPANVLGAVVKGAIAVPVAIGKSIVSGIKTTGQFLGGLFKFRSFSMAAMAADAKTITTEVEGLRKVYQAVLMVYNAVSKPYQPKKKVRKSLLDSNGDGIRDGSVEDQRQKRSKMAQWLADKKAAMSDRMSKVKEKVGPKASAMKDGLMGMLGKIPKTALLGGALGAWLGSKFKKEDGSIDGTNVAAGAATGAVGVPLMWAGAKMGMKAAGRWALTAALPGALELGAAALTGLGAVLTAPVTLTIAAVALAAGGGYLLYKHLTKEKSPVATLRMAQYGFKMTESKYVEPILNLEKDLLKGGVVVTDRGATIKSGRDPKEYLKLFGVDENDQKQLKEWVNWFHYRFKPVFLSHMVALKKHAKSSDLHKADSLMGRTEKLAYLKDVHYTRSKGSPYDMRLHPFASEPWFGGLLDRDDVNDAYNTAVLRAGDENEKTGAATTDQKADAKKEADQKKKAADKSDAAKKDEAKKAQEEQKSNSFNWRSLVPGLAGVDTLKKAWDNRDKLYSKAVDVASRGIESVANAGAAVGKAASSVANSVEQAVVTGTGSGWSKKMRADLFSDIAEASKLHGVPESYMRTMAWIESKGDPTAKAPSSSASGIYQFINSTAKLYGIAGRQFDQKANVDAGARLALDNLRGLRKRLGREPTPAELYLAHQQGLGGAAKLLSDPNAPVTKFLSNAAVVNNGGSTSMTAGQFVDVWRQKYAAAAKKAGVTMTAGERINAVTGGAVQAAGDAAKTAASTVSNAAGSAAKAVSQAKDSAVTSIGNRVAGAVQTAKGVYQQAVDNTSQAMESVAQSFATPWMDIARSQLGVNEKDHPDRIREYHQVGSGMNAGEKTPWCASFVGWVLRKCGVAATGSAAAASYNSSKFGKAIPITGTIPYGAILHIKFRTGNHVAFCMQDLGDKVRVIGGNQSSKKGGDQRNGGEVTVSTLPKSVVVSATIPSGRGGGASGSVGSKGTAAAPASTATPKASPAPAGGGVAAKPAASAPRASVPPAPVSTTAPSTGGAAIVSNQGTTQMSDAERRKLADQESLKLMSSINRTLISIEKKMDRLIPNGGKSEGADQKSAAAKSDQGKEAPRSGKRMIEDTAPPVNLFLH